jgi:hypothetical protein
MSSRASSRARKAVDHGSFVAMDEMADDLQPLASMQSRGHSSGHAAAAAAAAAVSPESSPPVAAASRSRQRRKNISDEDEVEGEEESDPFARSPGDKQADGADRQSDEQAGSTAAAAAAPRRKQPVAKRARSGGQRTHWTLEGEQELLERVEQWVKEHQGQLPAQNRTGAAVGAAKQWVEIASTVSYLDSIKDKEAAGKKCSAKWVGIRGDLYVRTQHTQAD